MQKYQEPFLTQTGDAAGYCSVLVKEYPGLATATIYSDDGITPKANPMTTDGLGNAPFYAANGRYQLTVSGSKVVTTTKTDIQLFDPADGVASSDVVFTPAGTGAVATTVQTKLREKISIFDKCTDAEKAAIAAGLFAVNVTAAVQAAVNEAREVYAPPGGYLIDTITVPVNTKIVGERGKTIFKQNTTTGNSYGTFYSDSLSSSSKLDNISYENFTIKGPNTTPVFSEFQHLITVHGVENFRATNVDFLGFSGDGLYVGSGPSGSAERHNTNVYVTGCTFDGVNRENRNGISVIDCDGFFATQNHFENCTKSTMPGAIDIEPDSAIYHVVRNINVYKNTFKNNGGTNGNISVYIPNAAFTVKPKGFRIEGNTIDAGGLANGIFFIHAGNADTTREHDLIVSTNTVREAVRDFEFGGINGYRVLLNTFEDSQASPLIGFSSGVRKLFNGQVSKNTFLRMASSNTTGGSGLGIYDIDNLLLSDNEFIDCGKTNGTFGYAIDFGTGTSTRVKLRGNRISSPNTKTLVAIQKEAGHTFTASTNEYFENDVSSLSNFFESTNSDAIESAYSPIVSGGSTAGAGGYSVQFGAFRNVGARTFYMVKLSVNAGHTGTGQIRISLPQNAKSRSSNAECVQAVLIDGAATTGGQAAVVAPATVVNGVTGCLLVVQTNTGTASSMTIPAGAFTVYAAGSYERAL